MNRKSQEGIKNNQEDLKLTPQSDSAELEEALYNIQQEIKNSKEDPANEKELLSIKAKEEELIKIISRRAKDMMKEEKYSDFEANMQHGIMGEFDNIAASIADGPEKDDQVRVAVSNFIALLKPRIELFIKDSGLLDQDIMKEILSMMDECVTSNREEFVEKLSLALKPIAEARNNNPRAAEIAQRKSFLRSSIGKEQFIPIEDTDDILSYGLGYNLVHLHLAPMRTLSTSEQLNFVKRTVPEAFHKLAEVLKTNEDIKEVIASSYVVAAMPDLFRKYGFDIVAMDEDSRNRRWGDERRPVLKATIGREEFLRLYGQNE